MNFRPYSQFPGGESMMYLPNDIDLPRFYEETFRDEITITCFQIVLELLKTSGYSNQISFDIPISRQTLITDIGNTNAGRRALVFLDKLYYLQEGNYNFRNLNESFLLQMSRFVKENLRILPPQYLDNAVHSAINGVKEGETVYFYIPRNKFESSNFRLSTSTNSNEYMLKKLIVEAEKRKLNIRIVTDETFSRLPHAVSEIRVLDDMAFTGSQLATLLLQIEQSIKTIKTVSFFLAGSDLKNVVDKLNEKRDKVGIKVSTEVDFFKTRNVNEDVDIPAEVMLFYKEYLKIKKDNFEDLKSEIMKYTTTKFIRSPYKNPDNMSFDFITHAAFFPPGHQDALSLEHFSYYGDRISPDANKPRLETTRSYPPVEGYNPSYFHKLLVV